MRSPPQHRLSPRRAELCRQPLASPHLNRDPVYGIIKAEGLNRLLPSEKVRKPHGSFKDYDVGFIHGDVKHLPKLQDRDRIWRKRKLYVAIDRVSCYVHLAVKDVETTDSTVAFITDALGVFTFQVTHVLNDHGSCFTADAFEAACERHGVPYRKTRPYSPKTNGMVERFNCRVQREVLGIMLYSHADLEIVLRDFNAAHNDRRQRVVNGLSPGIVLRQRLDANPMLANPTYKPPCPNLIKGARCIVTDAKEVSHTDS